jgi:rRNA maturation protein Nop10
MAVLQHDEDKARELQERLVECARQAEQQVNFPLFGNRPPTRQECGEELEVDGCAEPITRAMLLGRQKHTLALACAREVLSQLWPAPFSIEQRYRFYRHARVLESISRQREQQIIKEGCTEELWDSIKPDIVLHSDYNLLQAVLTLDFKFPCPPSNPPQWKQYDRTSAYTGLNQGQLYEQALGGRALLLSPQGVPP